MRETQSSDPDALLDWRGVTEILGVGRKTLEAWRREGRGPAYIRLSPTCVRYRRCDLLDWLEARRFPRSQPLRGEKR